MSIPANLPFSKVRRVGDLVFLSGELPIDATGGMPDGIGPQTDLTLARIAATLAGEGLTLSNVVQATVHLRHAEDFAAFNAAYARHFAAPFPTRTTVVAALALEQADVEITVVADASAAF
ncbi:RidA family protein [Mitsuaria sp. GD03876]|uniref:RidA family protein n=1 Tax=Mitsuaria sp. GD03876 TaxID=2975399 RepID=UPI00244BDA31|nr:RidA family protein [Mitsuaria sp. GD03876]MDH0864724.1 RidA family protein [Mitsuaria sp. GD03876]